MPCKNALSKEKNRKIKDKNKKKGLNKGVEVVTLSKSSLLKALQCIK
jgi:hypothetical protein